MKISIVLALFLLFAAHLCSAQPLETPGAVAIGPALELSVPIKSLADRVSTGFGGSARFEYVPYKNIALVATLGYISWTDAGDPGFTSKANAMEFLAGPKFGFGSGGYAGFELGIYQAKEEFTVGSAQSLETERTEAMAGAFIGYEFSGFDIGVKYYPFDSAYTNVLLSVGYWFEL
jgi:hypothetical protein